MARVKVGVKSKAYAGLDEAREEGLQVKKDTLAAISDVGNVKKSKLKN